MIVLILSSDTCKINENFRQIFRELANGFMESCINLHEYVKQSILGKTNASALISHVIPQTGNGFDKGASIQMTINLIVR